MSPQAPKTPQDRAKGQRDFVVQTVISLLLGTSAFLTFCFMRTRWAELYAARKRQRSVASRLPDLPNTFFGWIPVLYRISEEEVLISAGLDAYVFLRFFGFATKFLTIAFAFALVLILPVHFKFTGNTGLQPGNDTAEADFFPYAYRVQQGFYDDLELLGKKSETKPDTGYLWMYVAFVYVFTGLAIYLLVQETIKIIGVRQTILGSQSTVTDRTIRLSGIPPELRSEEKIQNFIEELEIGKVDSVMLCRDWGELDGLMAKRMKCLRRLEESWTLHLGYRRKRSTSLPIVEPRDQDDEEGGLLSGFDDSQAHVSSYERDRPTTTLRFGFLNLQSRKIDAIDYYGEKLRNLDEKIKEAREKEYKPTPLAFVTMDSTAACQMAIQAILSPTPMQLLAGRAPAPADIVWKNTYLPRGSRMARAWMITIIIGLLTILWTFVLVPLAGLLNEDAIKKVWPGLVSFLEQHPIGKSLVQTGLPTLVLSLLTVAVPYIYDFLANQQGMTSQGDVELSVISKNFFFTFFNLFVVFTIFGTVSNFYGFVDDINKSLRDTSKVAYTLAKSLERLAPFYVDFIILQGLGLFPFRLLEFGSVFLYPFFLMGSKTPRDHAELTQPPVFSYGFYLPTTILIFIICVVYSVLPSSWLVLGFGLIYFFIGGFVHKYQLLYAMDHRQHSTGRAWPMICNRVIIGLVVFQIAMIGVLSLRAAFFRSALLVPLLVGTIWFSFFFRRTYQPLMKFIALRSIDRDSDDLPTPPVSRYDVETDRGRTIDDSPETGMRFINPSLVCPLEDVWISKRKSNGSHNPHDGRA